jgi:hypothetical protein
MLERLPEEDDHVPRNPTDEDDIPIMHGSGIARKLYGRLRSKHEVAMLIMFALEGG